MPCPAEYRNLGLKSFGEQKYVTADMLRQFCKNDAYLKKMVDRLEYLTPPAVRKVFSSIPIDELNSYGYNQDPITNKITFDNSVQKRIDLDFNTLDCIDINKTTAIRNAYTSGTSVVQRFEVPKVSKNTIDSTTRNYSPWTIRDESGNVISDDFTCNEFWYIGFDRNRHYETRPNWLANMLNGEIPGISRAQTFKAKADGLLESVRLNLKGTTNTGMPLIVQIRRTQVVDGVAVPVDSDQKHLAYQAVVFNTTNPGVMSVTFDHPCTVKKGTTYAIVLLSPLSHPTNCYWIGGWNKHCHADVYEDGNAFYSFNSGYTWIRYGKDDVETGEEVPYHEGKYAPQDFAFQCDISQVQDSYDSSKTYYVYLKPIYANPITQIRIDSSRCGGDSTSEGNTLKFQVSKDGRSWKDIAKNGSYSFTEPRKVVFVRAVMKSNNGSNTPWIEQLGITLDMELPKEMYVRTIAYAPPLTGILSANVWGRIYAPFTEGNNTECTVEIIRQKEVIDHFTIINPTDLIRYVNLPDLKAINLEADIAGKTESQIKEYLKGKSSVITILRNNNLYVKGFITDFQFTDKPAYPTLKCSIQPSTKGENIVTYGEWYDYTVDYDNNTLKFYDDVELPKGTLSVSYNPIFIEGLTANEVGLREDKTEGLILDYFEETIVVDEDMVANRTVQLRAEPVDPIRKVTVMHSDGSQVELVEGLDYNIIDNKSIMFEIAVFEDDNPTITLNDKVIIVYTPNLDDNCISIGYSASRTNTDNQVVIDSNYIEYKS